jgi:hypothetical protein
MLSLVSALLAFFSTLFPFSLTAEFRLKTGMFSQTHPKTKPMKTRQKATGNRRKAGGAGKKPASPKDGGPPVLIDSLPMARYAFVVRGHLTNSAKITVKGIVHARRGLYYQARARALDSVLGEIPTLELDEDAPIGLQMRDGRCAQPDDPSPSGSPKP